jgi:hypothetical protein
MLNHDLAPSEKGQILGKCVRCGALGVSADLPCACAACGHPSWAHVTTAVGRDRFLSCGMCVCVESAPLPFRARRP